LKNRFVSAAEVVVFVLRPTALVLHVPPQQIRRLRRSRLRERRVLAAGLHRRGDHHGGNRNAVQKRAASPRGVGRPVYDGDRVFVGHFAHVRAGRQRRRGRRRRRRSERRRGQVRAAGRRGRVRRGDVLRRRTFRRRRRRRRGKQSATVVRQHAGLHERHERHGSEWPQVCAGADMKTCVRARCT